MVRVGEERQAFVSILLAKKEDKERTAEVQRLIASFRQESSEILCLARKAKAMLPLSRLSRK